MNKLYVILAIIFSVNISAQDTTVLSASFAKYYNSEIEGLNQGGGRILEVNDGFLIQIWKQTEELDCISLIKIDNLGEVIWEKNLYCLPYLEDFPNITNVLYASKLKMCNDGNFIISIGKAIKYLNYNSSIYIGGLLKFDENGDTIWTRFLDDAIFDFEVFMDVSPISDGGFVAAGRYRLFGQDSITHQAYIVKFDSLGYKQWEWIDGKDQGIFHTVFENEKGDIVAGGIAKNPTGYTWKDIYALRLSKEGEYIDEYLYENDYTQDHQGAIHPYGDYRYLVTGGIVDLDDLSNLRKEFVALLDTNLNPIWEKTNATSLNPTHGDYGLQPNVVVFPDGGFVGFGDKSSLVYDTTEYATDTPTLMFYNSIGELENVVSFQLEETAHEHWTFDLIGTSDGGLMLAGTTYWPNPDLDVYVIKTDENGNTCAPADCVEYISYEITYPDSTDVSVEDSTTLINDSITSVLNFIDLSNVVVTPNPAIDWVVVKCNNLSEKRTFFLYNSIGELVLIEDVLANQSSELILDISNFLSGIYFWKIGLHSGKLIIK